MPDGPDVDKGREGADAMEWDEPKAKSPKAITLGEDLSKLSVAELSERVEMLRAEIARAESAAEAKRKHSAAAEALFGKSE
jgi:uncharacterized small protein (DUF1192 family)